jgi:hypothetical protein
MPTFRHEAFITVQWIHDQVRKNLSQILFEAR